jgi:hypothetical protein
VVAATSAIHEAPTAAEEATTVAARLTRPGAFLVVLVSATWMVSTALRSQH